MDFDEVVSKIIEGHSSRVILQLARETIRQAGIAAEVALYLAGSRLTEPALRATIVNSEVIMLPYVFFVFALVARFLPHPWGFTPLAASLLFFGARGSRRQLWLPLVALVAFDLVLTKFVWVFPFTWDQAVVWGWYAAILWLGTRLSKNPKPVWIVGASLTSSVSFFVVSNFGTWAFQNMYPKTLAGLMTCYTMGLPFFRRGLEGDLLFTAAMFATPVLLHALSGAFRKESEQAAV